MGLVNELAMSFISTYNYILLFNQTYEYVSKDVDITGLSVYCHSRTVLCFGGGLIGGNTIKVIACAKCSEVLNVTTKNSPIYRGGAYWYFTPSVSFGFAPNNIINQAKGDTYDGTNDQRLSWHLDGGAGYRAGNNWAYNQLIKYVFAKNRKKKFYLFFSWFNIKNNYLSDKYYNHSYNHHNNYYNCSSCDKYKFFCFINF